MLEFSSWLQDVLFILSIVNLGFTLIVLVMLTIGNALIKRMSDLPLPELDRWPSISLIAPGRNEERNIEQAVRSLVQIDYPDLEITLVNDRSTDRTAEIMARLAAEFPRLNIVQVT